MTERAEWAARVVELLRSRKETIATAESLTGGLLCAALVDVPGASAVLRGGVVAYDPQVKIDQLGVAGELIERSGTVDPEVADAMAAGVRERLGATWGVSTTGVAGPDPSEGKPVGTVFIGVRGPQGVSDVQALRLDGSRSVIRDLSVVAALRALAARLGEEAGARER